MTIVYEKDNPSATFAARQPEADIKVTADGLVISNAEPMTRIAVYKTDGEQVVNALITASPYRITLQKGQAYLLKLGDRTLKFAL